MASSTIIPWTGPFAIERGVRLMFIIITFYRNPIPVFKANNVDLDQPPHSAASNLGLH